jgi:hypothetical protein
MKGTGYAFRPLSDAPAQTSFARPWKGLLLYVLHIVHFGYERGKTELSEKISFQQP